MALEGALKLKEVSYIHAEAFAAGEMKHGPIALIDSNVPVLVIAPKTASTKDVIEASRGEGKARAPLSQWDLMAAAAGK